MTEPPIGLVTNATDFAGPPAVAALMAAGFRLFAHDRAFADPSAREAFLRDHPGVEPLSHDVPGAVIEAVWERTGRLDAIVSNDHYPAIHHATETADVADLQATLDVVVVAPFRLLKAAIPRLKAQGSGNIVMITSCRMRLPVPGGAIPDAARGAANALARSLAVELAPFGIPVNAIAPNYLYSEAYYPKARFIDDPDGRAFVERMVPARRLGRPDEIGDLIAYLATTKASFLTGAVIDFAGGWPAAPMPPR